MKKILSTAVLIFIILIIIFQNNTITRFIMMNTIYKKDIALIAPNQYKINTQFNYVKMTDNFRPKNEADIQNILYTILNSGWDTYTFFCDEDYKACIDDVKKITNDTLKLSHLNNFVHPYNNYSTLSVNMNNFGKVTVHIDKVYKKEQIKQIDIEIARITKEVITDKMTDLEKISAFHDYIINHTVYDQDGAALVKKGKPNIDSLSHMAYGTLFNHISLCGGYSDTMSIFLNQLGIPNMKIANDEHVWNLVYLNNAWWHLDLTWDDPVVNTGENLLLHNFFFLKNNELQQKDPIYHKFDLTIYPEATLNQ